MELGISTKTLQNAELILRLTMAITLLIAGISKFFSKGGFHAYYLKMFSNSELRINLPQFSYDNMIIPYIIMGTMAIILPSHPHIISWIKKRPKKKYETI